MIFSLALLLPLVFSALISEYAARLAVFLEGLVNLSSFLFFLFVIKTGSFSLAIIFTIVLLTVFMIFASLLTEKMCLNPFIAGLGLNLAFSGFVAFASNHIFGTKGIVTETLSLTNYFENTTNLLNGIIVSVFVLVVVLVLCFRYTKAGLALQISGSRSDFLDFYGIDSKKLHIFSWGFVGFLSCFSGVLCTLKFSSFVPNVCSGRGWIALALIFVGKKKTGLTILATFFYAILEYIINNSNSVFGGLLSNMNQTLLLALPYFILLLVLCFDTQENKA